jgi:putative endonuclease
MFYIYILRSQIHSKFYTGYSDNPWIRVERHNTTILTTYTSKFRPWELAATFEVGSDENQAIRIERFLKKQHSKKLLLKLIDPEFIPSGQLAQLVIPIAIGTHVRD